MRIAYRSLAVAYGLVLLAFHADAQSELFPRPAAARAGRSVLDARLHRGRHEVRLHPRRSAPRHRLSDGAPPRGPEQPRAAPARRARHRSDENDSDQARRRRAHELEQRRRARAEALPRGHEQRRVPCCGGSRPLPARAIGSVPPGARPLRHVEAVHQRGDGEAGLAARARRTAARRVVVRSDRVLESRRRRHVAIHALDRRALHARRSHRRRAARSVLRDRRRCAVARRQFQRHSVVAARVDGLQPRSRQHAPCRAAAENHRHRDDRREVPEPLVRLRVAQLLHRVPRGARDRLESRAVLSEPEDQPSVATRRRSRCRRS